MTDAITVTPVVTAGPVSKNQPPPPFRIARLSDCYYISVAPAQLTNHAPATKQLSVYLSGLLEDETVVLSLDPSNYSMAPWASFMTFMGAIQRLKCKIILKCDKMDFSDFAYFYFLGNQLEFHKTGALFFRPLYSNNKDALSKDELASVSYLIELLRKAVDRGILTQDQFDCLDRGGYASIDYDTIRARKQADMAPDVILVE